MSSAEDLKNLGNKAFSSGDFQTALKYFTDAINLAPNNHILYSNRSGSYASLKQFEKALEDAQKCVSLKSDWAKGYSRLGAAFFGLEKYNEAEDAYIKGLELEPNNDQMKKGLEDTRKAKSASGLGAVLKLFQSPDLLKKLEANPKTRPFLSQPDFLEKLQQIKENPSSLQNHISDPRIMGVFAMLIGADVSDVEESMGEPSNPSPPPRKEEPKPEPPKQSKPEPKQEEKMDVDPNVEKARIEKEKGSEFYKKREFEQALEHFTRSKELEPNNITHITNIAAVHFEKGDYDKCIETCQEAVEHGREVRADFQLLAKAFARMGNAYMKKEDYEKAIYAFNKSLTEHRNPEIVKRVQEAQRLLEKKEKEAYIDPKLSDEARERGNELFKKHSYAESVKEYTEAIKRNPSDAKNYANRSTAYAKLMAWNESLKDAEEAIKVDSNYAKGYIKKANAEMFMKRYYDAIKTLDLATKVDKDNVHSNEILSLRSKCIESLSHDSDDAEVAERAQRDPEVQEILADPIMRSILQQMQTDPKAVQDHLKNPAVAQKIQKLINAGIIRIGGGSH